MVNNKLLKHFPRETRCPVCPGLTNRANFFFFFVQIDFHFYLFSTYLSMSRGLGLNCTKKKKNKTKYVIENRFICDKKLKYET